MVQNQNKNAFRIAWNNEVKELQNMIKTEPHIRIVDKKARIFPILTRNKSFFILFANRFIKF